MQVVVFPDFCLLSCDLPRKCVAMLAETDSTNVVEAYTGQETIQNEATVIYDIAWR